MLLRTDLPGGRRELRTAIGPYSVAVTEVPGPSMSEHEWQAILLARRSYTAMWGGGASERLANDPLDGRQGTIYDTKHYLARIFDGHESAKLVTMRKVLLVPAELTPDQLADPFPLLPADIQFWRVRTPAGGYVPLWDALRRYARNLAAHDELAAFRIASLGRMGTFPYGQAQRGRQQRERTAIAFAAIQLLATHQDHSLLYVCTLCPELRDRVLGVIDRDGAYVPPSFTSTEEILGLPAGSVSMDTGLPAVVEHKASFPGYFIDNDSAACVLAGLLDARRIAMGDLAAVIVSLIHREAAAGRDRRELMELVLRIADPDHRGLAELLTRPRLCKYLIPLLTGKEPLSRMSSRDLQTHLLLETGDGPFSSTLVPGEWAAGTRAVLEAVDRRYGGPVS